jgi:hypothetical protein
LQVQLTDGKLTVKQDWLGAQPFQLSVMTELPASAFPDYNNFCSLGLHGEYFVEGQDKLLSARDVSTLVFDSHLPSKRDFFLSAATSRVGYRQKITVRHSFEEGIPAELPFV